MANDMHFLFKVGDLKELIAKGAVSIEAFSKLESAKINNQPVALMVVGAEGFDANRRSVGVVRGCPCPPCTAKTIEQFT
jgi:hypothetical protein